MPLPKNKVDLKIYNFETGFTKNFQFLGTGSIFKFGTDRSFISIKNRIGKKFLTELHTKIKK